MSLLEKTEFKVTPLLKFKGRPLIGETSFIWTMTAFILAACGGGGGGGGAPVISGGVTDIVEPEDTVDPKDTVEPEDIVEPEDPDDNGGINGEEDPDDVDDNNDEEDPDDEGDTNETYASQPNRYFYGTKYADMVAFDEGYDGINYQGSSDPVKIDLSLPTDVDGYTSGHSGGFAEGDKIKDIHHIYGTRFKDILKGDSYPNWIYGAGDDDQLFGYGGNDSLFGHTGDDYIEGGAGADSLDGGRGRDWAVYKSSPQAVIVDLGDKDDDGYARPSGGDAAGDRLIYIENLAGSKYDDTLIGNVFNNIIAGLNGADIIDGGGGNDWVDYSASGEGVTVDLSAAKDSDGYVTTTGGHAEGDRLKNIENIKGSSNDDILTGDDGDNEIEGGAGFDFLTGKGGKDVFILNPYIQGDGVDTITDFIKGEDKLKLLLNEEDSKNFAITDIKPRDFVPGKDASVRGSLEGKIFSFSTGHGDFLFLEGFTGTIEMSDLIIFHETALDIA